MDCVVLTIWSVVLVEVLPPYYWGNTKVCVCVNPCVCVCVCMLSGPGLAVTVCLSAPQMARVPKAMMELDLANS